MSDVKPGDVIKVLVGGVEYDTIIDERGVQRFRENREHFLLKQIPQVWDSYSKSYNDDMNLMALKYGNGEISQRDYAEMKMASGYSVCGFNEISAFDDMILINPLWGEDPADPLAGMTDNYLHAKLCKREMTLSQVIETMMKRDACTKEKAEETFVENCISEPM